MPADILVVDDSPTIVDAARSMLEVNRVGRDEIVTASTGEEAMRLFMEHAPDTVLLGVGLPDADGQDLARDFQAADPHARVVAVTGLSPQDRRVRDLMEDDSVDLVQKPLEQGDLERLGIVSGPGP